MYSVLNLTDDILHCGNIGHKCDDFFTICEFAKKYGFGGINIHIASTNVPGGKEIKKKMDEFDLKSGAFGFSLMLFDSEMAFRKSITSFEKECKKASEAGFNLTLCYIPPFSDDLKFNDLFQITVKRLRVIKPILEKFNIKIGFEFIGPTENRINSKYDFIHTIDGIRALIAAADIYGFGGFKFDVHHWQNSGASLLDIKHLDLEYLLYVELNDGLEGYNIHNMPEFEREMPFTNEVTDNAGFLKELKNKGYKGPITIEPWNEKIKQMPLEDAISTVSERLHSCLEKYTYNYV